jgi:hypothetical protein
LPESVIVGRRLNHSVRKSLVICREGLSGRLAFNGHQVKKNW